MRGRRRSNKLVADTAGRGTAAKPKRLRFPLSLFTPIQIAADVLPMQISTVRRPAAGGRGRRHGRRRLQPRCARLGSPGVEWSVTIRRVRVRAPALRRDRGRAAARRHVERRYGLRVEWGAVPMRGHATERSE
jgi:hypothetical protein